MDTTTTSLGRDLARLVIQLKNVRPGSFKEHIAMTDHVFLRHPDKEHVLAILERIPRALAEKHPQLASQFNAVVHDLRALSDDTFAELVWQYRDERVGLLAG